MLSSKSIGEKIAESRKRQMLTQAELAAKVCISPQAVGKWERGESMPDLGMLNRLAEVLGVDLDYFTKSHLEKDVNNEINASPNLENTSELLSNSGKRWDMSEGNWMDADFSGIQHVKQKLSSSNLKNCKFIRTDLSNIGLEKNNMTQCDFSQASFEKSTFRYANIEKCSFVEANFSEALVFRCNWSKCNLGASQMNNVSFEESNIEQVELIGVKWISTRFKSCGISGVVFEGDLRDCHFENSSFYNVQFQNATLTNCFFKYNRRFKKVKFLNCFVDRITLAFLKNNNADLTGITPLED